MSQAGPTTRAPRSAGVPRLADDVGFLMSRGSALAVRAINVALEPVGLRVRQYSVLLAVAESGGLSQRDVATTLSLDPSQIVALVDELESRGLVERRPGVADRRARLVQPTRAGKKQIREAERRVRRAEEEYLGALDAEERETLASLLRRVNALD